MDTNKIAMFKGSYRLSKAHHFGALQPLVFGGVSRDKYGASFLVTKGFELHDW